jgi:23S rRNA (uracil1939-C5)-methyltransferase
MSRSPHLTVDIIALGEGGDGLAETERGRIYIADALPGDRVKIRVRRGNGGVPRGEILERLASGDSRAEPLCRHFGRCGGCAVQHVGQETYIGWKRNLVASAMARRGLDVAVLGEPVPGAPGRRRRARLFVQMTGRGPVIGFREARSHRIVPVTECPVLHADIVGILAELPDLFRHLLPAGAKAELAVTLTDGGLDMTVLAADEPDLTQRESLASFAEIHDVARISWGLFGDAASAEPVVRRRAATVTFCSVPVEPPPDAFLQPTAEGEAALRARIEEALAGASRVVDLYSGCGAFALPLASGGKHVLAIDSAADHVDALDAAARSGGFGEMVQIEARDLHHRPLEADELKGLDAVVLDPPRAGASRQAAIIAGADIPVVAYASCDPRSFARDARLLCDGGYRLVSVTPVDQFLFTPHVELVGIFRKV